MNANFCAQTLAQQLSQKLFIKTHRICLFHHAVLRDLERCNLQSYTRELHSRFYIAWSLRRHGFQFSYLRVELLLLRGECDICIESSRECDWHHCIVLTSNASHSCKSMLDHKKSLLSRLNSAEDKCYTVHHSLTLEHSFVVCVDHVSQCVGEIIDRFNYSDNSLKPLRTRLSRNCKYCVF